MVLALNCKQVVREHSHFVFYKGTILDLLILSRQFVAYDVQLIEGISDHKIVFLQCTLETFTFEK